MAMDIYKGWPFDGAINDNAPPKSGEGIVAGMAVKKDSNGELVKANGAVGEKAFFAMNDQASLDVVHSKSLPYIVSNAIVLTDQYIAASYTTGQGLEVSSASPGSLKALGTAPLFGYFDGFVTRDGIDFMKVIIP